MTILYLILISLILIKIAQNALHGWRYKFPPGPRGLPFLGSALNMLGTSSITENVRLASLYGDLHTLKTLGFKTVVINSMDVLNEMNLEHKDDFNHRPVWIEALVNFSPGIVFKGAANFEENKKFVQKNLKKHGMGKSKMELRILNETEDVIKFIDANPPLNIQNIFETFSSNVICFLCFGKSWAYTSADANIYINALNKMNKLAEILLLADLFPVLRWVPWFKSKYQEYSRVVNTLQELGRCTLNEKQQARNEDDSFDLTDDFLASQNFEPSSKAKKNFEEISQDMFTAGTLTTAATLTFCIIQLVNKPRLQENLYSEIAEKLGVERDPSMADVQNLPYTESFIYEILRFYPAVALIPHATCKDTTIRGVHIPANTGVSINSISINNNPNIFSNPKEFMPERWLDDDGKFRTSLKDQIITFGRGKRYCVGKSLARMEVFLMVVKLVQRYKLSVPKDGKVPSCIPIFGPATFVPDDFLLQAAPRKCNNE